MGEGINEIKAYFAIVTSCTILCSVTSCAFTTSPRWFLFIARILQNKRNKRKLYSTSIFLKPLNSYMIFQFLYWTICKHIKNVDINLGVLLTDINNKKKKIYISASEFSVTWMFVGRVLIFRWTFFVFVFDFQALVLFCNCKKQMHKIFLQNVKLLEYHTCTYG